MGKRKLCTGMIIGAIIGGLATLVDKDTRSFTKRKLVSTKSATSCCIKNPSNTIQNTRMAIKQFNDQFVDTAENTMNALEQIESTLDKVLKQGKS